MLFFYFFVGVVVVVVVCQAKRDVEVSVLASEADKWSDGVPDCVLLVVVVFEFDLEADDSVIRLTAEGSSCLPETTEGYVPVAERKNVTIATWYAVTHAPPRRHTHPPT